MTRSLLYDLNRDGFAIVPAVLDHEHILGLKREIEDVFPTISVAGIRSLASKVDVVRLLSQSPGIRSLIEPVLGIDAHLVRSIFFNKSSEANWQVAWHQDLAIAVEAKHDVPGFNSWSVKENLLHVQPPREVLESMLTVRVHLDSADESNGALWVSPGSHRLGRLSANEAADKAQQNGKQLCAVEAGDVLLFRPLLLHASKKATSNNPRRVIHFEYSGATLPSPLRWAREA